MANTIKIDPRKLPIPWTTSTNYRVAMTQGVVNQVDGVKFASPSVDNVSTVTTFAEGPNVVSVFPTYGTTSTFTSTVQITYNRPVVATTGTGNYYLYKADGTLVHTIESTSTRLTRSSKTAKINFVGYFEPLTTYYVTADPGMYRDLFRFPSPAIVDDTKIKFTIGDGPTVIGKTPVYGIENTFVTTSTISFSKTMSINTGNFYLNQVSNQLGGNIIRTIPVTSSSISIIGTNTVAISIYDQPTPEGDYFITFDYYALKDQNNLPIYAVSDNSLIKFSQKTIKDMSVRQYRAFTATSIFTATSFVVPIPFFRVTATVFVPQILDVPRYPDSNLDNEYKLILKSPVGKFTHASGYYDPIDNEWEVFGTKDYLNSIFSEIEFTPIVAGNRDSNYTYILERRGVVLVNKTFPLYGATFPLSISPPENPYQPGTRATLSIGVSDILVTNPVVNENVVLTAIVTSTNTLSGTVQFKENNVVIATAPLSGAGLATTTTTFATTGTRFISASWGGGTMPNGNSYDPLDTPDAYINVQPARELNAAFTISSSEANNSSFTNLYPVTFTATISTSTVLNGVNAGIVSLKRATFTQGVNNTRIFVTSNIINSVTSTGTNYRLFMNDNEQGLLAVGDWIEVSGTLTGIGTVKSNYQVTSIDGRYINVSKTRSETDNLYYPYDPLKTKVESTSSITLNNLRKTLLINDGVQSYISGVTEISTATLVNNKATFNLTLPLNSGTYYFIADWAGTTIAPKYYTKRTTNFITQNIIPRSSYSIGITATPNPFYVRNENGTGTNSLVTATITLRNYAYSSHAPAGVVSLYDGATLLGTGTLSTPVSGAVSTNITWSPASVNQIDTGTRVISAVYDGDIWNLPMTAVTATSTQTSIIQFGAYTKRNGGGVGTNPDGSGPAGFGLRVSPTTSTGNAFSTDLDQFGLPVAYRPETITFNATTTNVNLSGRPVVWYQNNTNLGTSNFVGTTATIQINTNIQSTGTYTIYAVFAQDFNFTGMTSNSYGYRLDRRSPTVSVTPAATTIYRPNVQTETASYRYKGTTLDRTGSTFRLTRDLTTSTDQIIAGASTVYTIDPKTISIGPHQFKAELIGDNTYYNGNYTYDVNVLKGSQTLSSTLSPSGNLSEYTNSPATLTVSAGIQRPTGTATVTVVSSSVVGTNITRTTPAFNNSYQVTWAPLDKTETGDMVVVEVRVPTKFIQGISTSTLVFTENTSTNLGEYWTYPDIGDKLQFWADATGVIDLEWYIKNDRTRGIYDELYQYGGGGRHDSQWRWMPSETIYRNPNQTGYGSYSRPPYDFVESGDETYGYPTGKDRTTYWRLIPRYTESNGTVTVCYAQLWARTNVSVSTLMPEPNPYGVGNPTITLPDFPVTYSMIFGRSHGKNDLFGRNWGTYIGGYVNQTPVREATDWFATHLQGVTPTDSSGYRTWASWYPSAWYYSPPYNRGSQYINNEVHWMTHPILRSYRTKPQINLKVEGETSGFTAGQVLSVGSISTATGTASFGPYNIPKGGHTFRVSVAEDFNYNTGTVDLTVIKYIK